MSATAGLIYTSVHAGQLSSAGKADREWLSSFARKESHISPPKWRQCGNWMNGRESAASYTQVNWNWWCCLMIAHLSSSSRATTPAHGTVYRKSPWNRNGLDGTMVVYKGAINLFRWLVWIRDIVHRTWRHATFIGYITTEKWPTEIASSNIV